MTPRELPSASAIDRDALIRELMLGSPGPGATAKDFEEHAARILVLLQPVEGVVLTPDEADFVHGELNDMLGMFSDSDDPDEQEINRKREALLARLSDEPLS